MLSARYRELAILAHGGLLSFRAGRLNELSPEVKLVAGFGLAFATLIAIGIVQHRSIQALIETDGWVVRTHAAQTELVAAYSDLQQAESGMRGYVATAEEEYLTQQDAGIARSAEHLQALGSLVVGDSQQQRNLDRLVSLAGRKTALMQRVAALRRDQGFAAASQELGKGEGLRLMNELQLLVDAMEARQNSLLEVREAASEAGARKANHVTALGSLLALALVLAASWISRRDALERRRAEQALKKYAADLARSNADLEQFAYVASHDLQEPLRMVASFTQLLAQRYRGKLGSDAEDFIGYAVDGARRMQVLLNDLLAYSRVGTRGKELVPTESEAALKAALTNLMKSIEETGATVTHDPLPAVMADETQLCQVFQNLVGNALKFHGSEPLRIHVSAQPEDGRWRFSVRDNGIGIDPQNAERIFVIFQRLHRGPQYPGTGLGLAISKRIVERHGGRIWVESELGKGATFYFTLEGESRVESQKSKVESEAALESRPAVESRESKVES
jgi:signal transduction histidine kinase